MSGPRKASLPTLKNALASAAAVLASGRAVRRLITEESHGTALGGGFW
jgi:hypothetical protein